MPTEQVTEGTTGDATTENQTQARTSSRTVTETPGLQTSRETPGGQRVTVTQLPRMNVAYEFEILGGT